MQQIVYTHRMAIGCQKCFWMSSFVGPANVQIIQEEAVTHAKEYPTHPIDEVKIYLIEYTEDNGDEKDASTMCWGDCPIHNTQTASQ